MKRLREISRFECDVRVLRNGFCKQPFNRLNPRLVLLTLRQGRYVSSGDLVPGDIYELSDPNLEQFPCDSMLLTGDCIVNESMLTGNIHCTLYTRHSAVTNLVSRGIRACVQASSN